MAVHDILKMGDPRLLRQAEPITALIHLNYTH